MADVEEEPLNVRRESARPPMQLVYAIEDGRVAGRPGPAWAPWDLAAIRAAGFSVIVSFDCVETYFEEIRAAGFEHKAMCVEDFAAPAVDQLVEFNEFVDRKLAEGKRVLAHCLAGRGRTGTFLASRLIWRGATVKSAVRDIRQRILASQGTTEGGIVPVQVEALHRFARVVSEDAAASRRK